MGLWIVCTLRIVSFLLPLTAWVFRFFVCTQAPVYLRLWMNTRNRIPKVRFRFCTARKCVQIREIKGRKPRPPSYRDGNGRNLAHQHRLYHVNWRKSKEFKQFRLTKANQEVYAPKSEKLMDTSCCAYNLYRSSPKSACILTAFTARIETATTKEQDTNNSQSPMVNRKAKTLFPAAADSPGKSGEVPER